MTGLRAIAGSPAWQMASFGWAGTKLAFGAGEPCATVLFLHFQTHCRPGYRLVHFQSCVLVPHTHS